MKLALISDTHSGVRNDSIAFHDKSKLFYDNVFFPYLKDHLITTIVHLGDLVDRRKYVNYYTANRLQSDFLKPIEEMGLDVHFLAGNHDCFYKTTNEVNSLRELLAYRENFHIYDMDTASVVFDQLGVIMIPWICDENRDRVISHIKRTGADVAFGHLELKGFEMFKGILSPHGEDASLFQKFKMVCTGHFHHKSTVKNIHYLGAHGEFTWADYDDPRGFHILDTNTLELTFIENPFKMFRKLVYDDVRGSDVIMNIESCMIKVIVGAKNDMKAFDEYITQVEKLNPLSLQILDEGQLPAKFESYGLDESQDTLTICFHYIDSLDLKGIDKFKLKAFIAELYSSV